jgi:SOUL heme-binding protein
MTERQKYEVLRKFDNFELRKYEPCVIAEVEMNNDYNSATSAAFGHLFNYIAKGNQSSQKIAMTAPVIATTTDTLDATTWKVAFVMPSGSKIEEMPLPKEKRVQLISLPAQECVALAFKGRATKATCEKKEKELRAFAKVANIPLQSETRINRFDPPFKPGFLHYNEIVVPLI